MNYICGLDSIERVVDIRQFYYYPELNRMTDEDGYVVFNIYDYITPSMLFLFLKKKEYVCFETSRGCFVELIYPEEDDELPFY